MARVVDHLDEDMNFGEKIAVDELRKLPEHWDVIANKTIVQTSGRGEYTGKEMDVIVVGTNMIFVLEVKDWRGNYEGTLHQWNSVDLMESRPSPIDQAERNARIFAGEIKNAIPKIGLMGRFVGGFVLLTQAESKPKLDDPRRDRVLLLDEVVDTLQQKDAQYASGSSLGEYDLESLKLKKQIWNWLLGLKNANPLPKQIGPYILGEQLSQKPCTKFFEATHIDTGSKRHLAVYDRFDIERDPQEFFDNQLLILQDLQDSGVVARIHDPPSHPSDRWMVIPYEIPKGANLASLIEQAEAPSTELQTYLSLLSALSKIHEKGIVHRFLSPQAIYVYPTESGNVVTVTDFFAARSSDTEKTISSHLIFDPESNSYAAPELFNGYEHASSKSDIYSATLMFLERISSINLAHTEPAGSYGGVLDSSLTESFPGMSHELRSIVVDALNSDPSKRPEASQILKLAGTDVGGTDVESVNVELKIVDRPEPLLRLYLKRTTGKVFQPEVPMYGSRMSIGRANTSDLVVHDRKVSRIHAHVDLDGHEHVLSDAHSRNGTFHNGARVYSKTLLRHKDTLKFGETEYIVTYSEALTGSDKTYPKLQVELQTGLAEPRTYIVNEKGALIGSAEDNDIVLDDQDIPDRMARIIYERTGEYGRDEYLLEFLCDPAPEEHDALLMLADKRVLLGSTVLKSKTVS